MTTAPSTPAAAEAVRVCSVPSGHPYVHHLTHPDGPHDVVRLPDPVVPGAPAGRWWPPTALEASWVDRHHDEFDVYHLHFGFEGRSVPQLRHLIARLRALGRPLVLTVHDLTNPHLLDQSHHDAQLDVLVPAADQVLTLTPGAAADVLRRWGRRCTVVPHPHVASLAAIERARPSGGTDVVLHLKSLRPALDRAAVPALLEAVDALPGTGLRVHVHEDVVAAPRSAEDASLVRGLRDATIRGRLRLIVHGPLSDEDLETDLASAAVSVLPYRTGTHSGWVELCHDLGTAVVASDVGHWQEQQPVWTYRSTARGPDPSSLLAALRGALAAPAPRATAAERISQRREIAEAHDVVYRRALVGASR